MKDRMKKFEESLTGGRALRKWHFLPAQNEYDDGEVAVLFFMDVEYDPVRVTYDFDSCLSIHADCHKWHTFSPEQMEWLAEKAREADDLLTAWRNGSRNRVYNAWGKPEDE